MESTDVGLASYIYSLGKDVEICHLDLGRCVFRFENCPEVRDWQSGQAMVNGLAFVNCYRTLVRSAKRHVKEAFE